MKRRCLTVALVLGLCLVLCACSCEHEWKEADCEMPRMCICCDETVGDPLGHVWQDATCAAPMTCQDCGRTRGEALPHTWTDATCTAPKTCQVCGGTEGESAAHTPGEWRWSTMDVLTFEGVRAQYCTVCEQQLEEEQLTLSSLHEDGKFLLTCAQFTDRFEQLLKSTGVAVPEFYMMYSGAAPTVTTEKVYWDGSKNLTFHARVEYSSGTALVSFSDKETVCPKSLNFMCFHTDLGSLACMVIPTVVDPTLTWQEGADLITEALGSDNGTVERNGIRYIAAKKDDKIYCLIEAI